MRGMDIKVDVVKRLKGFGYTVVETDNMFIDYLISKVEQEIKNLTNLGEIPLGLKYAWIDAVCAEFLNAQYVSGKLDNIEAMVVSSVKEGDTTVSYATSGSPQKQFLTMLDGMRLKPSEIVRYRVMVW